MKRYLLTLSALACMTSSSWAQSKPVNFDFDWKFKETDLTIEQFASTDISGWKTVNLPHDWDIHHAPSADAPTTGAGGYFPAGKGWYCKQVKDTELKVNANEELWLHFEGVYQNSQVFVNGKLAGRHWYGYTPFQVNITPYVIKGNNTIVVYVDNSQQTNCRWYSGSGIYRHVWLERHNADKMDDPRKLFVRTEKIYGMNANGTHADSAVIHITYDGKLDEKRTLTNVDLWSPEQPKTYDIHVGELTIKHGIREFTYDSKQGFTLNGQPMILNGACVHHDNGIIGAMTFDAAEARKVRLMKDAGFNLIRTAHNPASRAMLEACDSIGMLVIDEAFDGWYTQKNAHDYHLVIDSCYKSDITALVERDRNHPSVISWSIGNEVIERKEIRVVQTAQKFKDAINALDTSRPVTEALCAWDRDWEIYDPHAAVLDIVGYNYMMQKAESDHARVPNRVMWQTESYPRDAFRNWKHTVEQPYIIGDMVWTGLDYLGESGIGRNHYEGDPRCESWQGPQFPYHGASCGDVDLIGWRRPISHYRDMLWNKKDGDTDIYLAVREPDHYFNGHVSESMWSVYPTWESWNWKGWEGKDIQAEIYTKAPKVRLYLNDQLIATKDVNINTEYKALITLPYQPGILKAVSLDADGKEVSQSILRTSGEPASMRLTCDRTQINADGQDLAFLTLEVVDKDGNIVSDSSTPVEISIKGQGTLLAAATANLRDLEPKTSPKVTTYKGRALIVVRSNRKAGKVTITATATDKKISGQKTLSVK